MKKVFVAIDQMSLEEAKSFVSKNGSSLELIKVGLEFYLRNGSSGLRELKELFNGGIFLDLKLHDIPKTVERAISSLEGLPIDFLTIHLSGGEAMVKAALNAANKYIPQTKILGVSYLTSLGENDVDELWNISDFDMARKLMFKLACQWQLPGIVLSGLDLELFESEAKNHPHRPLLVTPGIRFEQNSNDDQTRILNPKEAFSKGADYLVIGRPLTQVSPEIFEQRTQLLREMD